MLPFELLAVQPRIGFLVSGSFIFVLSQEPNGGKLQWGLVLLGDTANHGACLKDSPLQRYQSRVPGQQQQQYIWRMIARMIMEMTHWQWLHLLLAWWSVGLNWGGMVTWYIYC